MNVFIGRVLIALFLTMLVIPVAAQAPAGQDQYLPMSQLQLTEQLPAARLLIAAYAFVWGAVFVYVLSLWRRLGKVEAEMRLLQSRLAAGRR